MEKGSKIYVAGHRGLVGSAILRRLQSDNYTHIITRTHAELDLTRQAEAEEFFEDERPEYVFLAAAKVGGIEANIKSPATFIYDNLLIQSNVINCAYKYGAKKLLFASSSCSYPRLCAQPMKEEDILSGRLEPTNEAYAIAKISGMKMIEAYNEQHKTGYSSLIFPNIYGPGDNFDLETSHAVPALIRKLFEAKSGNLPAVEIWGTGNARREFLYADDVAGACIYFMRKLDGETLNVGAGGDISIRELAALIKEIVGYGGDLVFNTGKPDGMPVKLLDVSRMRKLGWQPRVSLEAGIRETLKWFIDNKNHWVQ
ncbi:MAG: GDP-L-fucose synthase [Nitrospirota bacterium]|jgi:GDP-L-fucose synthase